MRLSPDASQAWRTVFIDWISALPEVYRRRCTPSAACPEGFEWRPVSSLDTNGNSVNSIFVITDKYSKGVRLRACHKSSTGGDVCEWLREELLRVFGWPEEVISDNDVRFGSHYKAYLASQGIDFHFTAPFHPEGNGQAERSNSTVLNVLRCLCNGIPHQWPSILAEVEFAINSTPSSTGQTPFSMVLQFPPRDPLERALGLPGTGETAPLRADHAIHSLARARLAEERARQKAAYDKRHRAEEFMSGDQVYLRRSALGVGRLASEDDRPGGTKLRGPFLGPFKIIRKKRHCDTYLLETGGYPKGNQWHISHLVRARKPGSLVDTPVSDLTPQAVLAARHDLHGMTRYLVVWEGMLGHSWELEEHLVSTPQGRHLKSKFLRAVGRRVPATSDHPLLQENLEWLDEVVA